MTPRRAGRRPGTTRTGDEILDAARRVFGSRGYADATIRAVAAEAGVDPALVLHYFESKNGLFAAAMALPVDLAVVVPRLLAGEPEGLGERVAAFVLEMMEREAGRERFLGMVRSAVSEPAAAAMLRDYLAQTLLEPVAAAIGTPDAALRAGLAGAQVVGLAFARHIVGVPPLAAATRAELQALLGPVLQLYLAGPGQASTPGSGEED